MKGDLKVGDNFVDFRTIKQNIPITSVLEHYRIALRTVSQNSLRGKCPLPTHTSEQSKESFGVDINKNIWACQSGSCVAARQGKKGGNIIDFVAVMDDCSVRDAALRIQEWFGALQSRATSRPAENGATAQSKLVAKGNQKPTEREVNKPLSFELTKIDFSHPYLQHRKIAEETAKEFGVGFFPGRGSMTGRVVIPIHNEVGELVAYAGRSIDDNEPKYKLPTGFHKSLELFNLHRIGECERVIVVEGFFDCMKVHQAGFSCVALMGSSLSAEQEEKLVRRFKRIVLFLDGDDAGRKATNEILAQLWKQVPCIALVLADGSQPDELALESTQSLLRSL